MTLPCRWAAIINAATLRGAPLAGTVELPQLAAMLFGALGVKTVMNYWPPCLRTAKFPKRHRRLRHLVGLEYRRGGTV